MNYNSRLLRDILGRNAGATSAELQALSKLSQASVSRALSLLGDAVVRLGRARSTRYFLVEPLYGVSGRQPVRFVDEAGAAHALGDVLHLSQGQLALQIAGRFVGPTRVLPWPLSPLKREGFLGRLSAKQPLLSAVLGEDLERWAPAAHVFAAVVDGYDLPGALVVGQPALSAPKVVSSQEAKRETEYEAQAVSLGAALAHGSSAGGEQPKLTARFRSQGKVTHVIVKFSPPCTTPFGERWTDLLIAEHTALSVLSEAGEPVSASRVLLSKTRTFFESTRFDRVGEDGRLHVVPLLAAHEAFVKGPPRTWVASAEHLAKDARLPQADVEHVRLWFAFGRLIANNDMHFQNVSLFVRDMAEGRFSLAPCYDMLPMFYRPSMHDGGLLTSHQVLEPLPELRTVWPRATELAKETWGRLAKDSRCSKAWRKVCTENARRL